MLFNLRYLIFWLFLKRVLKEMCQLAREKWIKERYLITAIDASLSLQEASPVSTRPAWEPLHSLPHSISRSEGTECPQIIARRLERARDKGNHEKYESARCILLQCLFLIIKNMKPSIGFKMPACIYKWHVIPPFTLSLTLSQQTSFVLLTSAAFVRTARQDKRKLSSPPGGKDYCPRTSPHMYALHAPDNPNIRKPNLTASTVSWEYWTHWMEFLAALTNFCLQMIDFRKREIGSQPSALSPSFSPSLSPSRAIEPFPQTQVLRVDEFAHKYRKLR